MVTPAQALMAIVPAETHLEIEAMISNRDIGFVEVGQHMSIKVDTFNFTRYGLLSGKACHRLSRRHYPRQATRTSNRVTARNEHQRAERPGIDLRRPHVARPTVRCMSETGQSQSFPYGVTVEISTGSRRIISYLLSPFIRYKDKTLRER